MDSINYNHIKLGSSLVRVEVKLAGKRVGEIKPVEGGFAYFPAVTRVGSKVLKGDVFPSLGLCKASLEAE